MDLERGGISFAHDGNGLLLLLLLFCKPRCCCRVNRTGTAAIAGGAMVIDHHGGEARDVACRRTGITAALAFSETETTS